MKKQTKLILTVSVMMALLLALLVVLNMNSIRTMAEYQKNALVRVSIGNEYREYNLEEISSLPSDEFRVVQRSTTAAPKAYNYTGVLLKELLAYHGVDIDGIRQVNVRGADGYMTVLLPAEIKRDGHVYLTYSANGRSLGTKQSGGVGPYQLVLADDVFAQRWCKYVMEISVDLK